MKDEMVKRLLEQIKDTRIGQMQNHIEFIIMHMSFATFQTLSYREFLILDSIRKREEDVI